MASILPDPVVINYQPASQPHLSTDELGCIPTASAYQEFSTYKQVIQPVTYRSLEHVNTTYKPLPQVVTIQEDLRPAQDVWNGCTPEQVANGQCQALLANAAHRGHLGHGHQKAHDHWQQHQHQHQQQKQQQQAPSGGYLHGSLASFP